MKSSGFNIIIQVLFQIFNIHIARIMTNKFKGNVALLITAIAWGSGFIAQKLGNNLIPPLTFNAIRQVMAAIVLCPVLAISLRKSGYLSKQNPIAKITYRRNKAFIGGIVCGVFMFAGSVLQQVGLLTVSAGKCGFITALYIVITPVFSIVLGGKVNAKTFVCVGIALVGFGFLSLKEGLGGTKPGDWYSLIGAMCFAAQIVAVNYFVDSHNDILISVLQMIFCGVVGITMALIIENPTWAQVMQAMPTLLYSTFVPTALGFTLQIVGQKYTDSTSAALIMSLESVFAAIFGAIILAERMESRELLGCALIFGAVILDQIRIIKSVKA